MPSKDWRDGVSRPIADRLKKHTQPIRKITIHYTGVKKNSNLPLDRKLRGLFRFSSQQTTEFKKNLWGDIPYNYYIDLDGKLAGARDAAYQPDTNTNYNPDGHVTIVVEGDQTDNLSPAQKAKLFKTIQALQDQYNLPTSAVGVHKHYAPGTSCPGEHVMAAIDEYRRTRASYRPNFRACSGAPKPIAPVVPIVPAPPLTSGDSFILPDLSPAGR